MHHYILTAVFAVAAVNLIGAATTPLNTLKVPIQYFFPVILAVDAVVFVAAVLAQWVFHQATA